MPAKDTRKLPDRTKVELVIAKEIKHNSTDTNGTLAEQFDVAEITVRKAKYDNLTENQKELYHQLKAELGEKALIGASLAIEKGKELVQMASSPRDLPGVTAFGKFTHDVYRLESGQSTANVAVQHDYTARCLAYLEAISKHDPEASVEKRREYLLNSAALEDVPREVREGVEIK